MEEEESGAYWYPVPVDGKFLVLEVTEPTLVPRRINVMRRGQVMQFSILLKRRAKSGGAFVIMTLGGTRGREEGRKIEESAYLCLE